MRVKAIVEPNACKCGDNELDNIYSNEGVTQPAYLYPVKRLHQRY